MIQKAISNSTINIYTNQWGFSVLACRLCDHGMKKQGTGIFVQSPDGSISDMSRIKKSQFLKRNTFDFLLDVDGDFDKHDIDCVRKIALHLFKEMPERDVSSKVPIELVYKDLCEYVDGNQKNDIITVSDGYCNVATEVFKRIVKENDYGYTGLEIQKLFKVLGLLRVNKGRMYDWAMTDKDGSQYRTISFQNNSEEGGDAV